MSYTSVTDKDKKPTKTWGLATVFALLAGGSFVAGLLSVLTFFVWFPIALFESWVANKIWNWFFVPEGFKEISVFQFAALMLIMSSIGLYNTANTSDKSTGEKIVMALSCLYRPIFALVFAYIMTLFM